MSVYTRMLGRGLPCRVRDLIDIPSPASHSWEQLEARARLGRATPSELRQLGLHCLETGALGLARRWLAAAVKRQDSPAGRIALAVACEELAQHEAAAAQLDAALATASFDGNEQLTPALAPSLLCAAGLAYERAGRWKLAAQRYSAALIHQPSHPFALGRLVALNLAHHRRSEAVRHLRSIVTHHPADLASRICLGHLLQMQGRYDEAAWEYEQALCLEPDSWELPREATRNLQEAVGEDAAIRILEQLVQSQPHFPDVRMRLGNLYSMRGDDSAARREYRRALLLHPDYLDCHIAMARHELRMGRREAAAEHFREALVVNEQHVEVYVGLARTQHHRARNVQANETLESAGRIANNSTVLLTQLAMLEDNGFPAGRAVDGGAELRTDCVEQLLRRCACDLKQHPAWNDLRIQQGMLLRMMGRSRQAVSVLRRAALLEPSSGRAQLQLGLALVDCGRVRQARDAFDTGLSADASTLLLQYRLSLAYCGELEFDMAVEKLEMAGEAEALRGLWLAIDELRMGRAGDVGSARRAEVAFAPEEGR